MRKLIIAAALAVAALVTGCGTAASTVGTSAPSAASHSANAAPSGNVPTDNIKGCNGPDPAGYDQQEQVAYNTACTDQQDGGLPTSQSDPSGWCHAFVDGNAVAPDTPAMLHKACMAGIRAAQAGA